MTAPATPTTHLLYLHGFRSSPLSTKARTLAGLVQTRYPTVVWWCPQLPASPAQAMALISAGTAAWPTQSMAVVGSSLGGFYASHLAARRGCRAVLLNPAVDPARDLARHVGAHPVWQSPEDTVFFKPEYVDELRRIPLPDGRSALSFQEQEGAAAEAGATFAVIAKGDEVLDWREMAQRHAGAHIKLLEGGDHALSDFDDHLPQILAFLNLARA